MARPIWTGTLSFGLLNVPVSLMSGERKVDLHFRMLDSRDRKPIRFERVNADTGEEVPWKDIIKAYEYDKGNYVVVEQDDIRAAAPESHETVEVETFVERDSIDVRFFEKPYVLVPGKKAEKGYVLLRRTLETTGKVGIARVVIRTREYLSAVIPSGDALLLILLRYPQELVDPEDYKLPSGSAATYRISSKEEEMAAQLVESMAGEWKPDDYHDEFRERLQAIIRKRIKSKGATAKVEDSDREEEETTTNVVDFMALLQKSLADNKRTPAKKAAKKASKKAAGKTATKAAGKAAKKAAPRKAAAKKAPARKRSA
jgi:DNA end-binding protein Ku